MLFSFLRYIMQEDGIAVDSSSKADRGHIVMATTCIYL